MADVQWTNEPLPTPRKMSGTTKVVLGCGLLILLGLGAVAMLGAYGWTRLTGAAQSMGQEEWGQMRAATEQLLTDPGVHELWLAHPELSKTFTGEDDLLKTAQ